MRVDLFDFELPPDRIALRPARPRDSARLLLVEGQEFADREMLDLPSLGCGPRVLLFNDTKVIIGAARGIAGALCGRARRVGLGRGSAPLCTSARAAQLVCFVAQCAAAAVGDRVEFGAGVSARRWSASRGIVLASIPRRRAGRATGSSGRGRCAAAVHRLAPAGR